MYAATWRESKPRPAWAVGRTSLFDALVPLLQSDADVACMKEIRWAKPQNVLSQVLLDTSLRVNEEKLWKTYRFRMGKCIVRPERVSTDWIHKPCHCFGRKCKSIE